MPDVDLLVLGGGPAGLGAAQRAARRGMRVALLEREPRVGGAARSLEVAGVRVDLGSHRLHRATDPAILTELERLLGADLQVRPRRGRIRLAGRWLPFPLSPASLAQLPPGFAAAAARDTATAWLRSPRADTFAERIRAGLGATMLDRFYGPYARKLWGLDPTEIHGEQARVRVQAATPRQLLARVVRGTDADARTFRYPRRGFGQLSEALAADARAAGAQVTVGCTATAVAVTAGVVRVATPDGEIAARNVWSTVPLPVLVRLLAEVPDAVAGAAAGLRTRAMTLAYAVLDVPRLTRYDAHYLPESWTPISRLSEPKNYRDGHPGRRDPGDPADRTVLCAEIPCSVGDRMWTASDRDLAAEVTTVLRRGGFPAATITDVQAVRLPAAYPVYDRGFADRVAVVDEYLSTLPGLLTFGRQGLFVHDNTHHALAMGWAAVDAADTVGQVDADAWAAARERFRTHVVED